jgi:hypothetical protein
MSLAIILARRDCRGGANRRHWVVMRLVSEFDARETRTLAVGATVAETDPDLARACLHESLELSTALGIKVPSTWFGPSGSHFS